MNVIFRAAESLLGEVRQDLSRPHPFAAERVGFISVRAANSPNGLLLLAQRYHMVADDDYIDDPSVGARFGSEAMRRALEVALLNPVGMFHVHRHADVGSLWFSRTDLREQRRFIPDFFKVRSALPHGALVLNSTLAAGLVWVAPDRFVRIAEFNSVGPQLRLWRTAKTGAVDDLV